MRSDTLTIGFTPKQTRNPLVRPKGVIALIHIRASRLSKLPPYLFVEIDRLKRAAIAGGRDVIEFGIGDPDLPTHDFIIDRMSNAISDPKNHNYSPSVGCAPFREAAAKYMGERFGVSVDPETEVVSLLGSKEGIGHLPIAIVNPGDVVLVPSPGYPVYTSATIFADGEVHTVPLRAEDGWLPRLDEIPVDVLKRAKLFFLNYPNNPTAACATMDFFEQAVAFGREHDILIAHDCAYADIFFGEPPPSILQVDGAKDTCIEFHSLSKTFNMTGWRVAFATGHAEALAALAAVKSNLDSGMFRAVQMTAVEALKQFNGPNVTEQIAIYRKRIDILLSGLREAGWDVESPPATFFAWVRCPAGFDSMQVASRLLAEADVVVVPGSGFGPTATDFIRFSLTVSESRTQEAIDRIAKLSW